jgi:hypothetical protein
LGEAFPHSEGINDLIETSAKYYRIPTPEERNAFIFNDIVNQKLHTLTEF